MKVSSHLTKKNLLGISRMLFWFSIGSLLGFFFFTSFIFIFYQHVFAGKVYPGVTINKVDFGGKTSWQIEDYFNKKNEAIQKIKFTFSAQNEIATYSAKMLKIGYNAKLLADQAVSIGRSQNTLGNISLVLQAYIGGVNLEPSYTYSESVLFNAIKPLEEKINVDPINAKFTFTNNRVTEFRQSQDGKKLDVESLKTQLVSKIPLILEYKNPPNIIINIPVKVVKPEITTDKVNSLGIKELLASGTSLFLGSIPNRIYNINLAASRLNGTLVAPNETFSFDKALGDVSAFTGYKQAYVIQNGHTILGDGGGVCQVSTTFFRAILNAGLPVVERNPHAYRVHYYEEDSPPGIDAAIFTPSVDLKFKNDTGHYILIQTNIDLNAMRLTFNLYGTKDQRTITITKPVILSTTPAPPPLYQDDPTLPKGQIKQVDFQADGASVYFTRTVSKDNKIIANDKFYSNYKPWQAVFLRGTKE